MTLSQLTYIISTFVFGGTCLLILWRLGERILRKNELALLVMIIISLPIAATEYFALKWQAWTYSPDKTLNIQFGTELDSYLFGIMVVVMISGFTLILAANADKKINHKKKRARKKHS